MREILFRGKRKDNGEWLYGNYCAAEYLTNNGIEHLIIETPRSGCSAHIIPETVGQFTGLTDKNGTKIFEGDIVLITGHEYPALIRFRHYGFEYLHRCVATQLSMLVGTDAEFEVIGNIHDNPELLSGKEGDL